MGKNWRGQMIDRGRHTIVGRVLKFEIFLALGTPPLLRSCNKELASDARGVAATENKQKARNTPKSKKKKLSELVPHEGD